MKKIPTYYESPHKIAGVGASEPVLLGLSGGADSTSLLYNLVEDGKKNGFVVYAAHVNHNIRLDGYNNEAARDEEFCHKLCDKLGVKLFAMSVDVPALARERGESLEGVARDVRYAFFSEIMERENISVLVTAHNASDNFETQLFNLCRGSGLSGLAGIPVIRPLDGKRVVVRPILSATKPEILEFCKDNGIPFVTDSTNELCDATRNKLRNNVIPALCEVFPAAHRSAGRFSVVATEISDFMDIAAGEFIDNEAEVGETTASLPCEGFNALHIALRRAVVSRVSRSLGVSLEYTHIQSVIELCLRAVAHSMLNLPDSLECSIEDGCLIFSVGGETVTEDKPFYIPFDGKRADIGDYLVATEREDICGYTLYASASLSSDMIAEAVSMGKAALRSRRKGDKIVDGGNSKKIKKLMCDKRISLRERATLPLLCVDGEIVYAPLCAVCDNAKRVGEKITKIFIYKKS